MTHLVLITGRQVAAARALSGISLADLANACGLTADYVALIENDDGAWRTAEDAAHVLRAFDKFGVVFVPESDGLGAGVRLKFTRADTRQLGRLEGEGGRVAEDDVP